MNTDGLDKIAIDGELSQTDHKETSGISYGSASSIKWITMGHRYEIYGRQYKIYAI